ncbi:hypothetical protein [Natronoarchaeum philippinense]|nr:hypothetical protein [Natronoarchaeum philippinense]
MSSQSADAPTPAPATINQRRSERVDDLDVEPVQLCIGPRRAGDHA